MSEKTPERRRSNRFDTDLKLNFQVHYELETKVHFQILDEKASSTEKHHGITRNISAKGLAFESTHQLQEGLPLRIELFLPNVKEAIIMEGDVRWCRTTPESSKQFLTGVRLHRVGSQEVEATVHFDERYQIIWSTVLESVLGHFRILSSARHHPPQQDSPPKS